MDDFLTKPISIDALKLALGKWLSTIPENKSGMDKPAPSIQALDFERFVALIDEITPLLVQNKFDAIARFKDLQAVAADTALADEVNEIGSLLMEFRFDQALAQLRQIAANHKKKEET